MKKLWLLLILVIVVCVACKIEPKFSTKYCSCNICIENSRPLIITEHCKCGCFIEEKDESSININDIDYVIWN
jgi:hypothetical protein